MRWGDFKSLHALVKPLAFATIGPCAKFLGAGEEGAPPQPSPVEEEEVDLIDFGFVTDGGGNELQVRSRRVAKRQADKDARAWKCDVQRRLASLVRR